MYCLLIMHLILYYTNATEETLIMDYLIKSDEGHKVNCIQTRPGRIIDIDQIHAHARIQNFFFGGGV